MNDLPILEPNKLPQTIAESTALSVQNRKSATEYVLPITWLARAGMSVSPWWSTARDKQLREFWKKSDHLSGAVYTIQSKMTAIPFRVVPRDSSFKQHAVEAEELTNLIQSGAEFGEGWVSSYGKFVEDLVTQDNGAFWEVIGRGSPVGPIIGTPISVAHLDSFRCTRTGDPEFPVVYQDKDGKKHRLHYTRVMFTAQMSSPIEDMHGVGFSSVSRCLNVAQTLIDILTFKQEKLGSRPHRAILIPQGGLDPHDIQTAFEIAESENSNQGLSRYSKVVLAGSASMTEADLKVIELSQLPDGFDEQTSITLGMATIALAFGMDARELFPAMTAGATRADSLIQHLKQRGKGPGQILQVTEQLFNYKFLPPYLMMQFDFQDDAEDRQVADIRKVRAERYQIMVMSGLETKRVIRKQMLEDKDLDQSNYERLELEDGRMADGTSVLALFYSEDPDMQEYLKMPVDDPLDIQKNKPETMLKAINSRLEEVMKIRVNTTDASVLWSTYQAVAALSYLEKAYLAGQASSPLSMFYEPDANPAIGEGEGQPNPRDVYTINQGEANMARATRTSDNTSNANEETEKEINWDALWGNMEYVAKELNTFGGEIMLPNIDMLKNGDLSLKEKHTLITRLIDQLSSARTMIEQEMMERNIHNVAEQVFNKKEFLPPVVNLEPQINVHVPENKPEIRVNNSIPAAQTMIQKQAPGRFVVDRDDTGHIVGIHEETV